MKNVYLLSANIEGITLYKIGYTKREVQKRVKELKTGNAADINIEKVYKADKYGITIEKTLHKHFKSKKVDGEWFDLSFDDVDNFVPMCEKLYSDFDIIQNNSLYESKKWELK